MGWHVTDFRIDRDRFLGTRRMTCIVYPVNIKLLSNSDNNKKRKSNTWCTECSYPKWEWPHGCLSVSPDGTSLLEFSIVICMSKVVHRCSKIYGNKTFTLLYIIMIEFGNNIILCNFLWWSLLICLRFQASQVTRQLDARHSLRSAEHDQASIHINLDVLHLKNGRVR